MNIAAPNAAGLSHNKFTDYNVGAAGLVLNNSRTAVQTQLGGVIAGNSQLGAKPAKVILNEVIGANPTMLNGTTEIAGKSAHLIVANPNGITVNGGGFINAPRTTLTTGKAMFDSLGNIANIDTTKGRIEIQGKGLDATRIDQLDLIARSIAVNAALHAEGAKVVGVGGVTRHNLKSGTTQMAVEAGLKGEGSAPRTVAIDVSKLGSMYANSIRLVGSPEGVGVNGNNGPGRISARSMPEWGIDPRTDQCGWADPGGFGWCIVLDGQPDCHREDRVGVFGARPFGLRLQQEMKARSLHARWPSRTWTTVMAPSRLPAR